MKLASLVLTGLLAGLATGCTAPIVGNWESDKRLDNGEKSKLAVFDDFSGEASIYATSKADPATWVNFSFDFIWEDEVDEFDFAMECSSDNCGEGNDFTMECRVIEVDSGAEKLDCSADGRWADYPLDWERDE